MTQLIVITCTVARAGCDRYGPAETPRGLDAAGCYGGAVPERRAGGSSGPRLHYSPTLISGG